MHRILGEFHPSEYHTSTIKTEFNQFLFEHGIFVDEYDTQIRGPDWHVRNGYDEDVDTWHNDCFGSDMTLIVWANICPTQIENGTFSILPYEVAMWTNQDYRHRRPYISRHNVQHRWFIRSYLYT